MTLSAIDRHFLAQRSTLNLNECSLVDLALHDMVFRAQDKGLSLNTDDALARLEAAFIRYLLDCRGVDTSVAETGFPALEIDKVLYKGQDMHLRAKNERKVVFALLTHLLGKGFRLVSVYDGDDQQAVSTVQAAMELIFNLDESHVWFQKEGFNKHYVFFVMGNAEDASEVISDWNYTVADPDGFDAAMNAFEPEKVI